MSKGKVVILLLAACALIAVIPLVVVRNSEFGGADGEAEEVIAELDPEYEPWASPVLEPPGGETESLLFCLQAALGAGVIGYAFGTYRERTRREREEEKKSRKNIEAEKGFQS